MTDRPHAPTAVLSHSGEIYNHHELRAELRGRGHRFRTRSDTEVVLRAYEEWGDALADHLDGMFAFAVWDAHAQRLLLVRDRLGVKPLFWAAVDGGLAFASEPKALFHHPELRPRVDADGLREAYSLLFNTGPTVWSGVREVEPGGLLVLDRDGIRERRYWQLEAGTHEDDRDTTVERIGELVGAAARGQLEADVPLCSLLSGGIDHYPATHHPDYNRGLQDLARDALSVEPVRALADEARIKPCLDTLPEHLQWGHRLRLERVVDLALWLDHHRPELVL